MTPPTTEPAPTPEQVEAVVAGLTKRSRRALPLIGQDWTNEGWGETLPNPNDAYSLCWGKDGKRKLVEVRLKPGTGIPCRQAVWQWKCTPLGLAVRARLLEQKL